MSAHKPAIGHYDIAGRKLIESDGMKWFGIEYVSATEDVSSLTAWTLKPDFHSVVVHLEGSLADFQSHITNGPFRNGPPARGDIWIVPAGARYAAQTRGGLVRYGEVRLPPAAMSALGREEEFQRELKPSLGIRDPYIFHSIIQLDTLAKRQDDLAILQAKHLLAATCLHVFDQYSTNSERYSDELAAVSKTVRTAQLVSDFINDNLVERIRMEDLVAVSALPARQFLDFFKRHFKTTPAQYVLNRRLDRARHLFAETDKNITQIAMLTGFSNHAHLTTSFKKLHGVTPRDFRRTLRS